MVLENLADLFRAQLADPARQSTLGREIELASMYLAIEAVRLGARLQVSWDVQAPLDAALPPLILQPLAENAVFHGIERAPDGGEIRIQARRHEQQLELTISNPVNPEPAAAAPATTWRWTIWPSGWSCISMPRPRSTRAWTASASSPASACLTAPRRPNGRAKDLLNVCCAVGHCTVSTPCPALARPIVNTL